MAPSSSKPILPDLRWTAPLFIIVLLFTAFLVYSIQNTTSESDGLILHLSMAKGLATLAFDEDMSKKAQSNPITSFVGSFSKLHFFAALAMFGFIVLMAAESDMMKRVFLLVPVILLYYTSKVMFAADQANLTGDMMERYKRSVSERYERER